MDGGKRKCEKANNGSREGKAKECSVNMTVSEARGRADSPTDLCQNNQITLRAGNMRSGDLGREKRRRPTRCAKGAYRVRGERYSSAFLNPTQTLRRPVEIGKATAGCCSNGICFLRVLWSDIPRRSTPGDWKSWVSGRASFCGVVGINYPLQSCARCPDL